MKQFILGYQNDNVSLCAKGDHHWRWELTAITWKESCKVQSCTYNVVLPTHREENKKEGKAVKKHFWRAVTNLLSLIDKCYPQGSFGIVWVEKPSRYLSGFPPVDTETVLLLSCHTFFFFNLSESVIAWRRERWNLVPEVWRTFSRGPPHTPHCFQSLKRFFQLIVACSPANFRLNPQ